MKKFLLLVTSFLLLNTLIKAQSVAINTDGSLANPSAMLDVKSTTKGMLIPRMTSAERTGIANPAVGLLVYDNETGSFLFYKAVGWTELVTGSGAGTNYWNTNGTNIYNNNTGNVGIGVPIPLAKLHVGGNVKINGASTVEFGAGVAGKEVSAGKIGYQTFGSNNALDIVGAGTLGTNRRITFWNEGGAEFRGGVRIILNNTLEFGALVGKEGNAGKIGYQTFTPGALDIVGAGTLGSNRRITFWNEGGAEFRGNVGIGTTANPSYKLSVNGNIRSKEVVVEIGWADYVFNKKYKLKPLIEVEKFIEQNKHLPGIPSAAEVEKNGLNLGDIQKKMMEKIEELTLYIIQLNKRIEELEKK